MSADDLDRVGPVDHIARVPLPWRTASDYTECGKPVEDVAGRLATVEDVQALIKRISRARAVYKVCMTCWDTVERWHGAARRTAIGELAREIESTRHAGPLHPAESFRSPRERVRAERAWARRQRLDAEVEALAALVKAHREEFDGYLTGRADTVSLADRRRERRMRGAR